VFNDTANRVPELKHLCVQVLREVERMPYVPLEIKTLYGTRTFALCAHRPDGMTMRDIFMHA
jgi:hypothetical protein